MWDSVLTVTVPATVKALTTIDNLRDELIPYGLSDTSMDGMLTRWINRASGVILSFIGRDIALATYQEVITPRRGSYLAFAQGVQNDPKIMLRKFPVVSLVSANNRDGTIDPTWFALEKGPAIIRPESFLWDGLNNISTNGPLGGPPLTFIYSAGYDLANTIPDDLESVCLDMLVTKWTRRGRDSSVQLTVMGPDVARTAFFDHGNDTFALNADMQDKLNSYVQARL